jgi:hypothetical protein
LWSLPKQDKEEKMMISMYPTEWDLPKQDKEELMILLGMSAIEWEKSSREAKEQQAQPKAWSFGNLVAALTWVAGCCLSLL